MKLVFLTVSLVAAFTVEPGPDSQHSITGEQPQMPEFTVGPDDSEETTFITAEQPLGPGIDLGPDDSEERTLITAEQPQGPGLTLETEQLKGNSTISELQLFDLEEEEDQSESELRGSNGKPKIQCFILGGSCVSNGARCYGRRVPAFCKGSYECCIPGCSEEQEFFSPPGSKQCFKIFDDRTRNWTEANAKCWKEGLLPAHPYDPVTLRSYIVNKFAYSYINVNSPPARPYVVWLYGRGNGTYITWQDIERPIGANNPLWQPITYSGATTLCLQLRADESEWKKYPDQPYRTSWCHWGDYYFALCEWKYGRVDM